MKCFHVEKAAGSIAGQHTEVKSKARQSFSLLHFINRNVKTRQSTLGTWDLPAQDSRPCKTRLASSSRGTPENFANLHCGLDSLHATWNAAYVLVNGTGWWIAPENAAMDVQIRKGACAEASYGPGTSRSVIPGSVWPPSAWVVLTMLSSMIPVPWALFWLVVCCGCTGLSDHPLPPDPVTSAGPCRPNELSGLTSLLTCFLALRVESFSSLFP